MRTPEKVILLVEDAAEDVFFFRRTLASAHLKNPVHAVPDVHEAICYLEGAGQYSDRSLFPLPSIAVVDLNLPVTDGFELLKWLRDHPRFHNLHIVVISAVNRLQDINRAYQLRASSFLTKPIKHEDLRNLAQAYPAHWI